MIRALIFDMDGLMVDTEPMYWDAGRKLAAKYGKTLTDQTLRKMMGRLPVDSMAIFASDCGIDQDPQTLCDMRNDMVAELFAKGVGPMPGLRDILDRFRNRCRYAVATSASKRFADILLPALGVHDDFDVVQTGDTVTHGKPDPEIYLKAMAALNVAPAESVVLEDSKAGATAGKRAGAYVVAVPSHLTASDDFSFADARVNNLSEATDQIEKLLAKP
jgi:HAD superfamily hydrolase (TIGR01509 family)